MTRPAAPALLRHALDRRGVLAGGAVGLGLALTPAFAALPASGFGYGVASGEPGPDRVLLWTRYGPSPAGGARLRWEVAESQDFTRPVAGGTVVASPARDWCVKPLATGLAPGRWYYYRFIAPDGTISPVGRTRTLPQGKVDAFRMAVFSCSNIGFGWFNAYRHAAADGRFDAVVHLGDYYYEYERGKYPAEKESLSQRIAGLGGETVAHYRADPDLRRLFQLFPWIMVWDDHETANDSWRGGAENHDSNTEGKWPVRVRAALTAYREWLPVSDESWAAYDIGDLATLFRLETRVTARDKPFDIETLLKGSDAEVSAALIRFRDGEWRDPRHTLLGQRQESWLTGGLRNSRRSGKTWQVLLQQVIMGQLLLPQSVVEGVRADSPEYVRRRIANRLAASRAGLPFNMDAWDGYPAARERLLQAARSADANLVVLAGDSHNAWASNITAGRDAAGVEFAGHSVTSPGAESSLPALDPKRLAADLVAANPGLAWCDTSRRGYMAVELTPARSTSEFRFLGTVRTHSTTLAASHSLSVLAGERRFAKA
jgi:alkaline phosphatase D